MNIGEVAAQSGLPAKTIRYYEDIGLIRPRDFAEADLHKLAFLGRARALGFSIEDCRTLLQLYEDEGRSSADVKRVAQDHLDRIAAKIEALEAMQKTLAHLVSCCSGSDRPDCPILDSLGAGVPH
jgi:MerR family copper efflux transcriptional regulator